MDEEPIDSKALEAEADYFQAMADSQYSGRAIKKLRKHIEELESDGVKMAEAHAQYAIKAHNRIAALEAALIELERWSNAHLGWSASLERSCPGAYKEIARVGQIVRSVLGDRPKEE